MNGFDFKFIECFEKANTNINAFIYTLLYFFILCLLQKIVRVFLVLNMRNSWEGFNWSMNMTQRSLQFIIPKLFSSMNRLREELERDKSIFIYTTLLSSYISNSNYEENLLWVKPLSV
jgi:hypothetical protein